LVIRRWLFRCLLIWRWLFRCLLIRRWLFRCLLIQRLPIGFLLPGTTLPGAAITDALLIGV
jgi:hypothetical protein